jgi:hypothetical protein
MPESRKVVASPSPNLRKFLLQVLIDVLCFIPTLIGSLVLPSSIVSFGIGKIEASKYVPWHSDVLIVFLPAVLGAIWFSIFFGILFIGVRISSLLKSKLGVQYFWDSPESTSAARIPLPLHRDTRVESE